MMLLAEYMPWGGFATIHNSSQRFTMVHSGSHNENKEFLSFSLIGDVNHCEPLKSNVLLMWTVKNRIYVKYKT